MHTFFVGADDTAQNLLGHNLQLALGKSLKAL